MRKILAIIAIFAIVIIFSCSKKKYSDITDQPITEPNVTNPVVINGTVSADKSFTFTLGNSGTATITKQAAHYQIRAATLDGNGVMVYTY